MIGKNVYRLLLSAALIVLAWVPSYALNVEVIPQEVVPGDVFLLKIGATESSSIKAEFLENKIELYPLQEGKLIALVPLDINSAPGQYKVLVHHSGEVLTAAVTVKPHEFKTIKLTLPEGKVTLSPENQKRVEKEYILQKKIWDRNTDIAWAGGFTEPTGTEVSTEFGVKRIMNEKKTSVHRGMDFRGKTGTPVKAINSGTVVLSSDLFYGGNTLIIDHGMGLYSVYMHLSGFNVADGSKVEKGATVGFVGSSGRATGPHLHLSVKLNNVSINPASLFKLAL